MKRTGENIYRRKDGRWEGRYIKGRKDNGNICYGYVYSRNFSDVKKKLFTYKMQYKEQYINRGKHIYHMDTFTTWAIGWLSRQEKKVKPNTLISYENKLKNNLIPLIGNKPLARLTSSDIQKCIDTLNARLAPSTVRANIRVLKSCLNEAIRKDLLSTNPLNHIALPSVPKKAVKAFTNDEQNRICKVVKTNKDLPILVALYTGLRIGEIAGLKWNDINWDDQVIIVRNNLQRLRKEVHQSKTELVNASLKTSLSHRVVPLGKTLSNQLQDLKEVSISEFVFTFKNNEPLDPRTIRNRFTKVKQKADVSDLPFHALRHTFATRCIEKGVSVTTISALLGHQSAKMTLDTYTNSFISEKRAAIAKLELMD